MNTFLRSLPLLVLTSLPASLASACDLHAGGQFGLFHPLTRQHYQQPADFQTLSLSHTRSKSIKAGGSTFVDIRYHVPMRYDDVSVSIQGSDGVLIESPQALALNNLNGNHRLKFKVLQPGAYVIKLQIAGTLDGQPFTSEQKIDVVSA